MGSGTNRPRLVIVAGGPGTGKTTIVYGLAEKLRVEGYSVYLIRDWAREIIIREKEKGRNGVLPWTKRVLFEYLVVKHHLEEYKHVLASNEYDVVLEDGGAYAAKAYCTVDDVPIPENYSELLKYKDLVDLVFVTEYKPEIYRLDEARWEDKQYALRLHEAIVRVHEELFNGKIIRIPYKPSIDERINYAYSKLLEKLQL